MPGDRDDVRLPPVARRVVCYFNFLGWWHWSFGIHVDVRHPHVGLHIPFGFVRVGWLRCPTIDRPRAFGYDGWQAGLRACEAGRHHWAVEAGYGPRGHGASWCTKCGIAAESPQ